MVDTQLKNLVLGEKSAVQVYKKILKKVKDYKEATKLKSILKDHENAVRILQMYCPNSSDGEIIGPWSNFAHTYNGKATLKSLRTGEEFEVSEYKQVLNNENITEDVKKIIKDELLPKQRIHVTIMSGGL